MENKKDRGELAIKIVAITLVVLAILGGILYIVFSQPKPHKDLDTAYVGRYDLVEMKGLEHKGITASSYEYNYILLGADGKYEIHNKYGKKKTNKKGIWYTEGNDIYFEGTMMMGLVKTKDKNKIAGDTITMTLEQGDAEPVVMILKRSAE